jgi:hypothetical protein
MKQNVCLLEICLPFLPLSNDNGRHAGSRPGEVSEFISIDLILPAVLGPGVYSV